MTLEEVSMAYSIELEKLRHLADSGLIKENADYDGGDLRRLGTMCRLYDMGFCADDIKRLLQYETDGSTQEYLAILKRRRESILDNVHREQKMLDDIDYMICSKRCFGK